MSRFTVGEKTIFAAQIYEGKGDVYLPWENTNLVNEIIVATCISEHTVPINFDKIRTGIGYIFKDQHGRTWYNQYPTASYGQLNDTNDRVLFLGGKSEENELVLPQYAQHVKCAAESAENKMTPAAAIHCFYFWDSRPTTLQNYFDTVFRFLQTHMQERRTNDDIREKCNALETYIGEMFFEVEQVAKCVISLEVFLLRKEKSIEPATYLPPRVKTKFEGE
jgi:hypothetical protein